MFAILLLLLCLNIRSMEHLNESDSYLEKKMYDIGNLFQLQIIFSQIYSL